MVLAAATETSAAEPKGPSLAARTWTWSCVIEGRLPGKVPFISDSGGSPFDGTSLTR